MNAKRSVLMAVMTSMGLSSAQVRAIDLVSTNALGQQGAAFNSPRPSAISNDGNTVLFYSSDQGLVQPSPGRANHYVKNMATGAVTAVIKRPDGMPLQFGAGGFYLAYMDEPPTRVVFTTAEPNLVPGTPSVRDRIFTTRIGSYQYFPAQGIANNLGIGFADFTVNSQLDRIYLQSSQLLEISATQASPAIIHSLRPDQQPSLFVVNVQYEQWPSLSSSGDGRILAWWNTNFDIDPKGNEGLVTGQIYIRDTQLGVTRQVRADNGENLHYTEQPSVSDDGSFVTFATPDSYFTAPCNGDGIYGIDTRSWRRECISVNTAGEPADAPSYQSHVSVDGNRVVFSSLAHNLGPILPGLIYSEFGVFVRDRRLGRTVRIDINAQGIPANGRYQDDPLAVTRNRHARISKNGRWVIFTSDASNLVPNDTNGHAEDIYRVDLNRFLPDPSLGAARLVPVPALSMMASFGLIVALLGFGIWRRRD